MTAQGRSAPTKILQQQTIMALAVSPAVARDGTLFAVTSDGILFSSGDKGKTWRPVALPGSGMAMTVAISPTFDIDHLVWASLAEGAISWSSDAGKTWHDSYATRAMSPSVALTPAPTVASDGLILAATLDDGVFRSTDKGRTWTPANFGLLELKTLGMVFCPSFASEQVALVATESALYRSRNGGLSWKEVGFWEDAVQSAVFSPDFAKDRRAWVGTESSGLMMSEDGGLEWRAVESFSKESINCLAVAALPAIRLLAGTGEGLRASSDLGASWAMVLPGVNVLSLAVGGSGPATVAFAATESDGLYVASGNLEHWQKVS